MSTETRNFDIPTFEESRNKKSRMNMLKKMCEILDYYFINRLFMQIKRLLQ